MEKKATTLEEIIKPRESTGEEFIRLLEKVFFIIRITLEETNPEKQYLIKKLAQMNIVAEQMLDNLEELVEVSFELSENIPDAVSKEYSKVILKKISASIENLHQDNLSLKETLAILSEADIK
jgi:sugar-specific transcriptional regulator TrmB